jgi:hypothetical protein
MSTEKRQHQQERERLLVTCSPFIRLVGLDALASALHHQALVDPHTGLWYRITAIRTDTQTHKIYGSILPDDEMNRLGH